MPNKEAKSNDKGDFQIVWQCLPQEEIKLAASCYAELESVQEKYLKHISVTIGKVWIGL